MDSFIEQIAQKNDPDEMIKANAAAEAKQIGDLEERVENYESLLQEMKQINLKNMESAAKITEMLDGGITVNMPEQTESNADIEALFEQTNNNVHRENVKVYRNVQAVVNDGLRNQTSAIVEESTKVTRKQMRFIKILGILILVLVAADVAIDVLRILGML